MWAIKKPRSPSRNLDLNHNLDLDGSGNLPRLYISILVATSIRIQANTGYHLILCQYLPYPRFASYIALYYMNKLLLFILTN